MLCNMKDALAFLFYFLFSVKTKIAPLSPLLKDAIAFLRETLYNAKTGLSTPFSKKVEKFFVFS